MTKIKPHTKKADESFIEQSSPINEYKSSSFKSRDEAFKASSEEKKVFSLFRFFSSFGGFLVALLFFVIMVALGDFLTSIYALFDTPSVGDFMFVAGFSLLLGVVGIHIYKIIKEIKSLKDATHVKELYKKEQENPSEEIVKLSTKLVKMYQNSSDESIASEAERLRFKLGSSIVYDELLSLNISLFKAVDKKANRIIKKASMQSAISTAISPVFGIDMLLTLYRMVYLAYELSKLYGYRSGVVTTYSLLKQGVFNVAFAGGSEMLMQYGGDAGVSSSLSLLSRSLAQGLANGILMVRIGQSLKKASRPIDIKEEDGAIKSIVNSIVDELKKGRN